MLFCTKSSVMCDYCQWIENIDIVGDGDNTIIRRPAVETEVEEKKKLEPIVIIHGSPGNLEDAKSSSILAVFRKVVNEAYKLLLEGRKAIDVVETAILQLEKEIDASKGSMTRSAALIDERGRMGCISGSIDSKAISVAKELVESKHPFIIQEESTKKGGKGEEKRDGVSGCWGVIARDKDDNLSCGRVSWEFHNEFIPSIPAATTVNGCGMLIKQDTCFSLSGNDEVIFVKLPARQMLRKMNKTHRHVDSKAQIMKMIAEFDEELGVVFLGTFNRPVIYCKSKSFPWAYGSRKMINYGSSMDRINSEDVVFDEEPDCTCHWRFEKYVLKI